MTERSIYEKVLGEEFRGLHPKLQKRYGLLQGEKLVAKGEMQQIKGFPKWLYPIGLIGTMYKLVFPESGENIPFQIKNQAYINAKGQGAVHWERKFLFPKKTRYFNAVMTYDEERHLIQDYLGEPSPLYSDLQISVDSPTCITIHSVKQRLVFGKLEIPLPKIAYGVATVRETYDETRDLFTIHVDVKNKLLGTVFAYEGVFQIDQS